MARKKLTEEEKKRLDNSEVPNIVTRRMNEALRRDDWDEADRLHQMMMDEVRKDRENRKKK